MAEPATKADPALKKILSGRFLAPDDRLSKKALSLSKGFPLSLTDEDVAKLEAVIERAKDGFTTTVTSRLRNLRGFLAQLRQDPSERHEGLVADIKSAAYELKGMGGMFGFPMLTSVAGLLHAYVDSKRTFTERHIAVVGIHIDVLYVILARQVTRMGKEMEQELQQSLAVLARKWP